MEESPVDGIDENTLDDAMYEVYQTTTKCLNTSLELVGMCPANLNGVPQDSRATSAKQKLDRVVNTY